MRLKDTINLTTCQYIFTFIISLLEEAIQYKNTLPMSGIFFTLSGTLRRKKGEVL
jgi:hypothetical protein